MNLQQRIDLLKRLGAYILSNDPHWSNAKETASLKNGWFIPEFINISVNNIAKEFLQQDKLQKWVENHSLTDKKSEPKTIGITMAGNIPLVGFHDLMTVFITGHRAMVKLSSKDDVLIQHLVEKLIEWDETVRHFISFNHMLKGCDAYIATGNNNTSRYFNYYFGKYPHIIRRNRTSVAILSPDENIQSLDKLADDVYLFFGRGCRNVTKIYVPAGYDFIPLLKAFNKYSHLADHHKYKNNYDYNLAILLLNKRLYMTNGSILLVEDPSLFSPISQLNFEYYTDAEQVHNSLSNNESVQCVVGRGNIPFGHAQCPHLDEYADGVDTMEFMMSL